MSSSEDIRPPHEEKASKKTPKVKFLRKHVNLNVNPAKVPLESDKNVPRYMTVLFSLTLCALHHRHCRKLAEQN